MRYVDAYILPVPAKNIAAYRKMAKLAGKIWMEHGALAYIECLADDMDSEWAKGSFPKMLNTKKGEIPVASFVVFKSRKHRDKVNAKVHKDSRLAACGGMENVPFDVKRMIYGGFKTLVDL